MDSALRKLDHDDLELVRGWRNHPDINKFMFTQAEISAEAHRTWFERSSQDESRHLLIYQENAQPVGFIQLTPLRNITAIVEWGFYVAPEAVKGTGTRMTLLTLDYAFNKVKIHKVFAEILDYNEPSVRLHQKLGFSQEGHLKDHHFDGENYHSVYCFGLINPLVHQ